jgi:integrase
MKHIDYREKELRKIKGMYTVFNAHDEDKTYQSDPNAVSVVFSPKGYLVEPAFYYLKELFHEEKSKEHLNEVAKAISNWYNFLRLYGMSGKEQITKSTLGSYIKYISVLPKDLKNRITIEQRELEYLPVHPYIEGIEDTDTVNKIYKEWYSAPYTKTKGDEEGKVLPLHISESFNAEVDEEAWRHPYSFIDSNVQYTIDFLYWLGESERWNQHFKPIKRDVVRLESFFNKKAGKTFYKWIGIPNITKITNLKQAPPSSEKKRIFFESELRSFLEDSKSLVKSHQRKFMFILLLLTGMRISECLNLLMKNVRLSIHMDQGRDDPFSEHTVVHWEDLFKFGRDELDKTDIYLDRYLQFYVKVKKRPAYEDKRRKNKKDGERDTMLRDVFVLPELLELNSDSIFIKPENFFEMFRGEIIQRPGSANDPFIILEETINYYRDCNRKGIELSDSNFSLEHKIKLQKIRSLIDNSWFGGLLRNHLIERHILQKEKKPIGLKKDYLFINPNTANAGPFISQIPLSWLNAICKNQDIKRNTLEHYNKAHGHKIKNDLTLHSFRHTYISARIGKETREGRYNPANLKKEVGHTPNSQVTETVYYWAEHDSKKETKTAFYRYLEKNLKNIKLYENDEADED